MTLKVISNSPASHYLPSYFEGETVRGNVVLTLEKEDSIKSITVQVPSPPSSGPRVGGFEHSILPCSRKCLGARLLVPYSLTVVVRSSAR